VHISLSKDKKVRSLEHVSVNAVQGFSKKFFWSQNVRKLQVKHNVRKLRYFFTHSDGNKPRKGTRYVKLMVVLLRLLFSDIVR